MRYKFSTKTISGRLIIIALLALAIFLLMQFANHPQAVERYYSQGLYPAICWVLHPVLNLFPFSVGDVLYIVVIGYLLFAFCRFIYLLFKGQFKRMGLLTLRFIISLQIAILVFYIFWGL